MQFNNQYFAMRHGQSEANVSGIIVSDPAIGVNDFGLSLRGRQQVLQSARQWRAGSEPVAIISSDFLRARETALLVEKELMQKGIKMECSTLYTGQLRERYFGRLDGQPDYRYGEIWDADETSTEHEIHGAESIRSVINRATELIHTLEQRSTGIDYLLVAHGDVLQILQTWFAGESATSHRQLPQLKTAEIRRLSGKD